MDATQLAADISTQISNEQRYLERVIAELHNQIVDLGIRIDKLERKA